MTNNKKLEVIDFVLNMAAKYNYDVARYPEHKPTAVPDVLLLVMMDKATMKHERSGDVSVFMFGMPIQFNGNKITVEVQTGDYSEEVIKQMCNELEEQFHELEINATLETVVK